MGHIHRTVPGGIQYVDHSLGWPKIWCGYLVLTRDPSCDYVDLDHASMGNLAYRLWRGTQFPWISSWTIGDFGTTMFPKDFTEIPSLAIIFCRVGFGSGLCF